MNTEEIKNEININEPHFDTFILDPLSVIIKLSILGKKPVGTKICIVENIIHIQEAGIFQPLCRYLINANKNELQYLYNPIYFACEVYLKKNRFKKLKNDDDKKYKNDDEKIDKIDKNNKKNYTYDEIKNLFTTAQHGILKLLETYKQSPMVCLSLQYYYSLIENYYEDMISENLFIKNDMTIEYNKKFLNSSNMFWSNERIRMVLDIMNYIKEDEKSDIKSMEIFMNNIEKNIKHIYKKNN
jgi:hypothetical protein